MAKKICSVPGCPEPIPAGRQSRCQKHRTYSPTYHQRDWAEQKRRKAADDAHVETHGYWCPGWGVPAHESTDLTADHVTAVANGGGSGPLAVLCRSCNSRKAASE